MSQDPQYQQYQQTPQYPSMSSLPYAAPEYHPGMPTSVRVIAIIGLVLGGLTFLNHLLGIAMFMGMNQKNPLGPGYRQFNLINSLVFGSVSIWQLAGCIGLLMLKEWARKIMLAYAIGYPILVVIAGVVTILYVIPVLIEPHSAPSAAVVIGGMKVGAIAAIFITGILPAFMLVYLRKPEIMARFTA